ncbi:hypothetical protein IV417_07395 [Alphaproteobacteria bacterium KMM 3653]|uniref:Uncharacterized protein n=1 Tax=Harenicola maris TaxID=2841044 RepID=A0AAP2CNM4_9RHOB|nr:hypothetical protein [Harenicola maris]
MNNYHFSLHYELAQLLEQRDQQKAEVDFMEQTYQATLKTEAWAGRLLKEATENRQAAQERFREGSIRLQTTKQQMGEIEEELFSSGEESEDYFH